MKCLDVVVQRQIHEDVNEGDTVVEIGSGLGTYSFFAADAGASRVTALDGGSIHHVAATIGRFNGYANVEFRNEWFPGTSIPEPVALSLMGLAASTLILTRRRK